jgi:ABC-2 type transport system ATP-binding protein
MEPVVLEIKNLTKSFGKYNAVTNLSFTIKSGEIVGLLGPNGAGKTTTIYMLLGLLTPTKGSIYYFGKEFQKNREEIMHKVNFSSTYLGFPWKMSVYNNLDILARLYNVENIKERIDQLLEMFEINDLRNQRYGDLSAGQKTRVFLAKAFINFPKVLLLDEPTASLDPEIAVKVRELLKRERGKFKTSMLFTSHNMAEVEEVCDRVIFIDHGKIIAQDTPQAFARRVKKIKVRFLFESNIRDIEKICFENKWKITREDRFQSIEVKEKEISQLLGLFAKENVEYSEISIDKPSLEDYFLEVFNK